MSYLHLSASLNAAFFAMLPFRSLLFLGAWNIKRPSGEEDEEVKATEPLQRGSEKTTRPPTARVPDMRVAEGGMSLC